MQEKNEIEKYITEEEKKNILKSTRKTQKFINAVYDRQMIRKILRNQLKTNKIKDAFHDKEWLRTYIRAI